MKELPHPLVAAIPLVVLIGLLAVVIALFGSDSLSGGSQVSLLAAMAVCVFISMVFYKEPWKSFEQQIEKTVGGVAIMILILLAVGMLAGAWMISGVVPTLIYYGVQMLSPQFFLLCACVICALVSLLSGSSWTTIATIGVALLGISHALGVSEAIAAGAIIGLGFDADDSIHVHQYTEGLGGKFNISLWTLLVPVLTSVLIVKRVPSLIVLFLSALMAGVMAIILQPHILKEIAGDAELGSVAALTKGLVMTFYGPTNIEMGSAELNELVSTGGMAGMLNTIWLIVCAMCFGAVMVASGMIESITRVVISWVKSRVGLVASTASTGLFLNVATGDQFISIVLTVNMFKNVYEKQGYEPRLVSRTAEDSATVTSVLVPWNTCGLTQSTVLGVATIAYLPYCFFNILSPVMTILVAALGWKIKRKVKE